MTDTIASIIRDVAELPDRNSPEGWPEAMIVTGDELRMIIERHIVAGEQGAGDYPHEQMDAIAAERYKVLPTNAGFWPFCVTAGDGERQLYKGHRNSCEAVARQLTTAFQDGGFAATALMVRPQPMASLRDACNESASSTAQPPKPSELNDEYCRGHNDGWEAAAQKYRQPKPAGAVLEVDGDLVLIERGLIGAACHAIEKKRDAPNLLEKLRAVTMAAGRADAVPSLDVVLRSRGLPTVADALGYSRNFAAANPALSQTTRDHIEGLCDMLEIAAKNPAPAPQPMTTQGEAVGPLSGKYAEVLRPFLSMMEHELHANAGKGDRPGWLRMSTDTCLLELYYHLAKLQKAVRKDAGNAICEHAADVANLAMMLMDICGGLEVAPQPKDAT